MTTTHTLRRTPSLTPDGRAELRQQVLQAGEPVAPFWPMRSFAKRNPLQGLEHLPFDQAVREATQWMGGRGYLAIAEYRQFLREGRITLDSLQRALQRVGPPPPAESAIQLGIRRIGFSDVTRLQLLYGMEPVDPSLLAWTTGDQGALRRFQADLPPETAEQILHRCTTGSPVGRKAAEEEYVSGLWNSVLESLGLSEQEESGIAGGDGNERQAASREPDPVVDLPFRRTVGDWLDQLASASVVARINDQMAKWTAVFVDEGMAGWSMPGREAGFFRAWRNLAEDDLSGRFLGIAGFRQKVRALPEAAEDALVQSLEKLEIPEPRRPGYLTRHLAQLPGWAGYIRWLGDNPDYPGQLGRPIDPLQYLAVRLFYEAELAEAVCRREWGIPGTVSAIRTWWQSRPDLYRQRTDAASHGVDSRTARVCRDAWRVFRLAQFLDLAPAEIRALESPQMATLLEWLDLFPEDRQGPVWLEAYESVYRDDLIGRLQVNRGRKVRTAERPRAQLVCCIDVRSEPFRRLMEEQGPYETYGFAGFFGAFVNHQAFDSEERNPLCPVLFKPKYNADEIPRDGQEQSLQEYASGSRWYRLGGRVFHDLKQNPVSSLMLIDLLGFFYSARLIGKTLLRKPDERVRGWIRRWFARPVATQIAVDRERIAGAAADATLHGLPWGLTVVEQANSVEFGLRMMGLTANYGRFVVLCGHGSATDNNPYSAALDCGACGGKHGDPNARIFAGMANRPEVRQLLRERGLAIPDDTWFLAAKHNTTSDRVGFYDLGELPASHRDDLAAMTEDLRLAGIRHSLERCGKLPGVPKSVSPASAWEHVVDRTVDWSNVRPEWGLSRSAALLIGKRELTEGVDLAARVFLHSYDPAADGDGKRLEFLMTAPLLVVKWLNTEYYFSAVDPWVWGSGSKVIHNVVSGVGVMLGAQGDLQTGLPLQSVNDGEKHFHEPMRLLVVIQAPTSRITPVIGRHTVLQNLFHNQWVTLVAVDPDSGVSQRYSSSGAWEAMP